MDTEIKPAPLSTFFYAHVEVQMKVELRNFHVIIKDHDLFEENLLNFHTIFFDSKIKKQWEIFLAEVQIKK
jgi:hypothetical protein